MPYLIADEEFKTKEDIKERCRSILADTPDELKVKNGKDIKFLFELFKYHDEWAEKSSGGVLQISAKTTEHNTRCFNLVKVNGSEIDISFNHAVRLIPTNRTKSLTHQSLINFKNSARTAIKNQIKEFRDAKLKLNTNCVITGELLHHGSSAVDHISPHTFDKLLFDFCAINKINPIKEEVLSREGVIAEFQNKELEDLWKNYHRDNAKLRLLSKTGNLQLKKQRIQ